MYFALRKQLGRLSIRLTLWHALLFLAAALSVLGLTYLVIQRQLRAQEHDVIEFRLNQYAGEYERGGLPAVRFLANLRKGREQKAFFVRLGGAHNRTLFLRDADDWAEFRPERLVTEIRPDENTGGWLRLDSPIGTELVLKSTRLSDGSLLQVGKTTEGMVSLLAGFRTASLVVILIFLPASIAGGAFLVSQGLRPIQDLTNAAEQIVATANFDSRVPSRGTGDELDALVQLFNKMLARIARLICGMRESLDNVAHDLRTPMTRLRQKAQLALGAEQDLESTRDALADCVEEAERAMTLLNTLMDIAEAESGLISFARIPVAVSDLFNSAMDSYAEVAEEKGVAVSQRTPPDLFIEGDAGALRRVFANLLDNAIKYTPTGGAVELSAERSAEFILIAVRDNGAGISSEDLPRIWDRLFRGDRSRTERGLGLGLSFVRAIVESHRGQVRASSFPGRGTTLEVILPAIRPGLRPG